MTTTAATKADRFANRAPKGGAVSPVNGLFYAGGRFMPMVVAEFKSGPVALMGSFRQVAWANRIRRDELGRLDDEIAARLPALAGPRRSEAAGYRPVIRNLLIARHALMAERSAAAVIDRRMVATA
jgi:hypothetical protein